MLAEVRMKERWGLLPDITQAGGLTLRCPCPPNSLGSRFPQSHLPLTTGSFWDTPGEGEWGAHPLSAARGGHGTCAQLGRVYTPASGCKLPDL